MFKYIKPPMDGNFIRIENGKLVVPKNPIVAYIEGDGIGPEVISAARAVIDEAIDIVYGDRYIVWWELYAGEKAVKVYGELLPNDTIEGIRHTIVALKGPLTTPIGTGYRSLNVALRQVLDLYINMRPVYFFGQPAPHKYAEHDNFVIFRENTEDLYLGIEWRADSEEARKLREFLRRELGINIRDDAGLGLKIISRFATKRIVRKALRWAIENGRRIVTVMHKGNIMKYTEGAFREWAYEVALNEFRDFIVTEEEVEKFYGGKIPEGKILFNDRVADNMFQQLVVKPWDYDVIIAPNVNGDYISELANALVGGVGIAPSLNIGDYIAVAEPVHGTAPKYAGKDVANPMAAILSGTLLLDYIGWKEASNLIRNGLREAIRQNKVTQDIARHLQNITPLKCSEFTKQLIEILHTIK